MLFIAGHQIASRVDNDALTSQLVQRTDIISSYQILGGFRHHCVRICVFGIYKEIYQSLETLSNETPRQSIS